MCIDPLDLVNEFALTHAKDTMIAITGDWKEK